MKQPLPKDVKPEHEDRECPRSLQDQLTKLGGYAPDGISPIYRIVWAPTRMVRVRGELVPKYATRKRTELDNLYPISNGEVDRSTTVQMNDAHYSTRKRQKRQIADAANLLVFPTFKVQFYAEAVWVFEVWTHQSAEEWNRWRYKWDGF